MPSVALSDTLKRAESVFIDNKVFSSLGFGSNFSLKIPK